MDALINEALEVFVEGDEVVFRSLREESGRAPVVAPSTVAPDASRQEFRNSRERPCGRQINFFIDERLHTGERCARARSQGTSGQGSEMTQDPHGVDVADLIKALVLWQGPAAVGSRL